MSDFNAKIKAILDTSKVDSQIKDIEKHNILFKNITFDTSSIESAIQKALSGSNLNLSIGKIDTKNMESQMQSAGESAGKAFSNSIKSQIDANMLRPAQSAINNLTSSLSGKGLNQNAISRIIESITANAKDANIQITKISDAFQSAGKNAGQLKRFRIEGIDGLGNAVHILDTFDAKTGELNNSVTTITRSFTSVGNAATAMSSEAKQALENVLNTGLSNGKFKADLDMVDLKFQALGTESTQLSANLQQLKESFDVMSNTDNTLDVRVNALRDYMGLLPGVRSQIQALSAAETAEGKAIKEAAAAQLTLTNSRTLSNNIQAWMNNNTKAAEQFGEELRQLQARLSGNMDSNELRNVSARFREIQSEAKQAGLVTNTFATSMKNFVLQCAGLTSAVAVFHKVRNVIGDGVNQIVALDDALVDLQKTTDATTQQLNDFYYESNEIAKQYGATTQEIIQSASDWSRLGYSIEDAETMAKVSSIFKSISPGLDIERATDGLVSAMKAFDIEAEDALDGIASKINAIGNSQAVSNEDIVDFLVRSSSAMKEANNSLEETISLGVAATEITRDAGSVGNALKTNYCLYVQKCA